MDALDGNAIGGTLLEIFGMEMTTAHAVCAHCGAAAFVAELVVYLQAPGKVVRCRSCEGILLVLTERRGVYCVDMSGLAALEPERRQA